MAFTIEDFEKYPHNSGIILLDDDDNEVEIVYDDNEKIIDDKVFHELGEKYKIKYNIKNPKFRFFEKIYTDKDGTEYLARLGNPNPFNSK